MIKPNISSILIKGAKLTPVILPENNERINKLIEYTMQEQQKIVDLKNKPFDNLTVTI